MKEQIVEDQIGGLLRERGWQLAVAESCTGGLVGHMITNIPGASTYFLGGVIAYAYHAKVRLLQVSWETLEKHGAVSEATVKEMARGVRKALGADIGLSISGIAGPTGGTPEKPIGTAWMGLDTENGTWTHEYHTEGDRLANKKAFAAAALTFFWEHLKEQ
jgi:PncC family amidohydrolase